MLPELDTAWMGLGAVYPFLSSAPPGRAGRSVDTLIDASPSVEGEDGALAGLVKGDCHSDPEEGRGGSGSRMSA